MRYTFSKMNQKVSLRTLTRVSDGQGGYTSTYTDSEGYWAEVMEVSGYRELEFGEGIKGKKFEIVFRNEVPVLKGSLLVWGDYLLTIHEIKFDPLNKYFKRVLCYAK